MRVMARPLRKTTCLTCKRICVPFTHGRCKQCDEKYQRKRNRERQRTREQPWYDNEWRKLSRETIEAHVRTYGYVCTKCDRADPRLNPLQLDHVKDRTLEHGVQVLCRSCNASKGARSGNAKRNQK